MPSMEGGNAKVFPSDQQRLAQNIRYQLKLELARADCNPAFIARLTACALCEHAIPVEIRGLWEIQCSICGATVDLRNPGDQLNTIE